MTLYMYIYINYFNFYFQNLHKMYCLLIFGLLRNTTVLFERHGRRERVTEK